MIRIVISMTTSPNRMEHLRDIVDSLWKQSVTPDAIYLSLPELYRNQSGYRVPDWLAKSSSLTILRRDNDLGPIMKLLPALEAETDPDTLIITIDDDVRYPSELISAFKEATQSKPEAAFGSRGFNFTNQGQHLQPVRGHLVQCDVLQGYGACAYKRSHFKLDNLKADLARQPDSFRFSDDVLISNHIASNGVPRFTVQLANRLEHMPWGDEDPQSLKFIDGGTHRRYEAVREWFTQENRWFAQAKSVEPAEDE